MSSILEKLMILIQMDASGLKQGAEQVQTSTDKIDHALDKTSHHASAMGHVFGHLKRELTGFVFSMIGIGAAIEGVKASFDYFSKVSDASDKLQVNVSLLDAWNEAVVKAGGTAESFDESIKRVAEHFNTSNATVLKVLPQFADLFHRFNSTQAQAYGKKLGFDEPTIQLLHQGGKSVEEIIEKQKRLGVITQQQKEIMDKYNAAWGDAKQQFRFAAFEAEMNLLPALTKVVTFLGNAVGYFNKHPDFVKSFVVSMAAMSAAAWLFGKKSEEAAKKSAKSWGLVGSKVMLAAAAIGLAYDDWEGFKRGDESVTGEILKRWPEVGKVIVAVGNEVEKAMKSWVDYLELALELMGRFSNFVHLNTPKGSFTSAYDPRVVLGFEIPHIAIAKQKLAEISSHPINSYVPGIPKLNSSPTKVVNIHVGPVTVNTQATDAQAISLAIGKGLYDHLFQTQSQLDDGQMI